MPYESRQPVQWAGLSWKDILPPRGIGLPNHGTNDHLSGVRGRGKKIIKRTEVQSLNRQKPASQLANVQNWLLADRSEANLADSKDELLVFCAIKPPEDPPAGDPKTFCL